MRWSAGADTSGGRSEAPMTLATTTTHLPIDNWTSTG